MPRKEVVTYTKRLAIPEDKIAEYKEAFDMFDKDGSGTISVIEIVKIMKNFGYPIKKSEAQQMIADIDDNGDGELDFEEFVTLMEKQTNYVEESDEELVLRAFKSFDKDHDGKITKHMDRSCRDLPKQQATCREDVWLMTSWALPSWRCSKHRDAEDSNYNQVI